MRPDFIKEPRRATVFADGEGALVLEALDDTACRAILAATGDTAQSAGELSEACDLPLSTTYRKLDRLAEAGLVEQGIRIRRSGKHTNEYRRAIDAVHVVIDVDGGIELSFDRLPA